MTGTPIRIIIVGGSQLLRQGLVSLFQEGGFEVLIDFDDGRKAAEQASELAPDVAVISFQIVGLDAVSTARRIKQLSPKTEIVFLTSSPSEQQMREAFESSGRAYLTTSCSFEELSSAVRKASCGDYYLSGNSNSELIEDHIVSFINSQKPGGLMTQREREIARLLADGYSSKEVADILNISPKTADAHRASIMKKLGAKNVTDIVKYCIRNHLIET
jgi:DNA-binding NarL/FixJ family response regulator